MPNVAQLVGACDRAATAPACAALRGRRNSQHSCQSPLASRWRAPFSEEQKDAEPDSVQSRASRTVHRLVDIAARERSNPLRLLVFALVVSLTGCGPDPYADQRPDPKPPPGEQPAPPLPRHRDKGASHAPAATPAHAARRAAELTTNWTGETAAARYAELARITVGAARRDARQSAARLPTDPQLVGTRSIGTVEAIVTRTTTGRGRHLMVVTHETLSGDGVRDRRWRVTLATVERRAGGWVVSRWEPQP